MMALRLLALVLVIPSLLYRRDLLVLFELPGLLGVHHHNLGCAIVGLVFVRSVVVGPASSPPFVAVVACLVCGSGRSGRPGAAQYQFRPDDASTEAVQQRPDLSDGSSSLNVVNLVVALQELFHVSTMPLVTSHERLDVLLHFLERAPSLFLENRRGSVPEVLQRVERINVLGQ